LGEPVSSRAGRGHSELDGAAARVRVAAAGGSLWVRMGHGYAVCGVCVFYGACF